MTPREVGGLQALAKAHGGTLTRNPETGLYEAGFLEQVLPIVAMAAATYFTAGAAAPMLMSAGMGATSAGILAGAGAGALISGGSAAIQGGDVGKAALMGGVTGAIGGGLSGLSGGTEALTAGADPNVALGQSTQVGTNALNVNPSTGAPIDPLTGTTNVPSGGTGPGSGNVPQGQMPQLGPNAQVPQPGINNLPSSVPNQAPLSADQITNLKSTQTDLLDRLAADKGVLPEGDYRLPTQTPGSPNTPLNAGKSAEQLAGDRLLKQQADAVTAAKADPNSSWWSKQTPMEKAAYTTAGAGILAGMNPKQTMPAEDTSDDGDYLKRISPNFRAQEPIRPNPYYRAQYPTYAAEGGSVKGYAGGGPVGNIENMPTMASPFAHIVDQDPNGIYTDTFGGGHGGSGEPLSNILGSSAFSGSTQGVGGLQTLLSGSQSPLQAITQTPLQSSNSQTSATGNNNAESGKTTFGFGGFDGGSGGGAGAGNGGPFPLEGQYGIVKMALGGIADLGSYSDGGRLLKGPGDGVSDNIPATIGGHQPARLADGEFVVPARIVSELGNGSTDAGAKRLYAMMERVQAKRKKSMGKGKFAVNSKADKDLPV
jgi:hypothetical protein